MKKILFGLTVIALALSGCSALDVVGKDAVRAFDEILRVLHTEDVSGGFTVTAPDGAAIFGLNSQGVYMAVDSEPFIAAGLVTEDDQLVFRTTADAVGGLGSETLRKYIGYHMEMDHYNIQIGDGNLFEWAKDMAMNDKDIVFVLNPEPLIEKGLIPEKVEGWIYAEVTSHASGRSVTEWKLLKPFDLNP